MEHQNGYMPETTLRDYLKVLFRHKAIIITTFITVIGTVIIGLQFKTPVYQAQVKMLISAEKQVKSPYYRQLAGYRNGEGVLTQSEIVKSSPVIERAVRATGLYQQPLDYEKKFCSPLKNALIDSNVRKLNERLKLLTEEQKKAFLFRRAIEGLKKSITVEPVRDTNLFTISAREFSPIGAAIIANVISRSYVIFDLEQQLAELQLKYGEKHLSVTQLKDNIEQMKTGLNGKPLSNLEAIGPASVKIIEQAQVPLRPVGPNKALTLILALFMAPFLGVMLAFMFEYMDQTFKSPRDIETFLNLPYLGSIPRKKSKKESLHTLSDQTYLLMKDKGIKSLLLTSALAREGTTTIIANLAKHLSERAGHKVLIIDANLRAPAIHKAFKLPQSPGLADVLEGKVSFDQAVVPDSAIAKPPPSPQRGEGQGEGGNLRNNEPRAMSQQPKRPSKQEFSDTSLHILPAGETTLNPITLLGSSMMPEIIKMAKQRSEIVLIDCANLKGFKDAVLISSAIDGIALVVNEGKTRRYVVNSAIAPLQQRKANIIGVILNNRTFAIPRMIYERV